ncbi:MAG TPA: radical SAM family heme chaperone HemW, partial [Bacteroidales bacterium]|nr:radical SAM family heme chaperone HemW [Bacteroidales bacterium]
MQKDYLGDQIVSTIYFGGGTPSVLGVDELKVIFDRLYSLFHIEENAEITLEANPDDVNSEWVREMRSTPVNRISMGVQSFRDDDLRYLNRVHTAGEAISAIKHLQDGGIPEITVDLIYGIPGLGLKDWEQNLKKFFSLSIPHLSAYALTVEEKTPLHVLIAKKKMEAPDEMASVDHFKLLLELCRRQGYLHYEISNFALEGHYSRHNSLYWTGGHYLGLGPSAHSFNGRSRRWNVSSIKKWLEGPEAYQETFEEEVLSKEQRYNEYVMTSLRTMWGCDTRIVNLEFGEAFSDHLMREARQHITAKKLVLSEGSLFLTDKGKLFADGIASDLFI